MSKRSQRPSYFAPGKVAEMLMVSPATVRLWASKGELASVATPGGHRRFLRQDIERFAQQNNLVIQRGNNSQQRVLVVDDDPGVARLLVRLLESVESDVETMVANDGYSAGRLVQTFEPHIVLLDLMMPGINGFDVCQQIKSDPSSASIRVIAMTGYYDQNNVNRAIESGAECCIKKPFDKDELLTLMQLNQMERN